MFELTHPRALLILALVLPGLLLLMRGSIADLASAQRRLSLIVRGFVLLCLVLALAGVRMLLPNTDLAVLFVVDQSESISEEGSKQARAFIQASLAHQQSRDTVGVIGFAAKAMLLQPPGKSAHLQASWAKPKLGNQSDLGGALRFASAIFPANQAPRMVLLTDGNDTRHGAAQAAQTLGKKGIEIFTVPIQNPITPETLVEKVEVPKRLKTGEPFDLVATLRSNTATKARVKLYQNQFLIETRSVSLNAGSQEFRVPNLRAEGNAVTYEVELVADADTSIENNRAQATASMRGKPLVLLVDADETKARPLAEALRRENIEVQTRGPLGAPKTLEELQQFDLLMLSDISALTLGRESMELYRRWVQEFGGGFVMLGGENSFGVGGYFRTPIEQMLPVRTEHDDRQDVPSVALLVVLDRSGSMTAMVQGQTKMSLANQGALFALNVLQPKDYFGVLAVDVRAHTVAALQQHPSKGPVEQKILAVTAGGGGIYIYTSLAESFQLLRDIPARIKHVILFSDAADAEEKSAGEMGDGTRGTVSSLDLAAAMLSAKITTSVVALGSESDKDTPFLRELAERGNGRFYLTSDATTLPQIFSTETMKVAQSSMVEEPFLAVASGKSPVIDGIDWAQSPLLVGYNSTKPKPTADVLLATERGEPLLAIWRYGLGHAAAFTSDAKGRWASEWLSWPGYGKFWPQLVRAVMRKTDQASFAVTTHEFEDRLTLQIDAVTPEGAFRNQLPILVNAFGTNGSSSTVESRQEAPGQYRATVDLAPEGTTLFHLTSPQLPDGGYDFAHTRSYPREFLTNDLNRPLLEELAKSGHGKYAPTPDEIFARPAKRTNQRRDLTDYFLMAALGLFPLDIWIRRRTWR